MTTDRRLFLTQLSAAVPFVLAGSAAIANEDVTTEAATKPSESSTAKKGDSVKTQDELEKQFAEKLSGCLFAGSYSVSTGREEKPAVMEKYTISKVAKVKDDQWQFTAKWQIGKNEFPIVIPLTVKWAGTTPVITLDELTIPGLGTFSSRVLIHDDWYAGTWRHDKVGGHLWGRIERPVKS